jgi:hypothetical protein
MGYEIPVLKPGTLLAAADLSTYQFRCVKMTTTDNTVNLSGAGEAAIGILQNEPTAGQSVEIELLGISKAEFGATVTAGDMLMSDSVGRLIAHTGTNAQIAIALEGGTVGAIGTVALLGRSGAGFTNHYSFLSIPVILSNIADGDIVTNFLPGFAGEIISSQLVITDPVTTTGCGSVLSLEIGAVAVTGGAVTLTSANCTPLGNRVAGAAITAGNAFTALDTISVVASATAAFSEGEGVIVLVTR